MRQVDAYAQGNPQAIQAAMDLSWEEFWTWLDNQYKRAMKNKK